MSSTDRVSDRVEEVLPFQGMVRKRWTDCGCVDECRCAVGRQPRVNKSTIYHTLKRLGRWEAAAVARTAFVHRLMAADAPRKKATDLSWRLLEDALFSSECATGFNLAIVDVELDGLLAFGEERQYPTEPTEEQVAATLAEISTVFGEGVNSPGRLPTTITSFYQRLGLWPLAQKFLERKDPDRGEIENRSTSGAWRELGCYLSIYSTLAEIRDAIRPRRPADRSDTGALPVQR